MDEKKKRKKGVKISKIGRPELQKFIGAITTKKSREGTFVAEDFASTVYEENEKAKKQGYNIELITKKEIFRKLNADTRKKLRELKLAERKFE